LRFFRAKQQNKKCEMEKIGDYFAMETLGEGSSGQVRVARHYVTNEKVALKIVSLEKFQLGIIEMKILATVTHPSLVKMLDVFEWVCAREFFR
jgi:serine/threonine protein kinase